MCTRDVTEVMTKALGFETETETFAMQSVRDEAETLMCLETKATSLVTGILNYKLLSVKIKKKI